jgi:hypothetical protein
MLFYYKKVNKMANIISSSNPKNKPLNLNFVTTLDSFEQIVLEETKYMIYFYGLNTFWEYDTQEECNADYYKILGIDAPIPTKIKKGK